MEKYCSSFFIHEIIKKDQTKLTRGPNEIEREKTGKQKYNFYFFRFRAYNKLNTHIKQQIVKKNEKKFKRKEKTT